jgi:hypothetical protein
VRRLLKQPHHSAGLLQSRLTTVIASRGPGRRSNPHDTRESADKPPVGGCLPLEQRTAEPPRKDRITPTLQLPRIKMFMNLATREIYDTI